MKELYQARKVAAKRIVTIFPLGSLFTTTNSQLRTITGVGNDASLGDGGLAISAPVSPYAITTDANGNIYIANHFNRKIRK